MFGQGQIGFSHHIFSNGKTSGLTIMNTEAILTFSIAKHRQGNSVNNNIEPHVHSLAQGLRTSVQVVFMCTCVQDDPQLGMA